MLTNLGLFGLFLGCMLAATLLPFSSETLAIGALALHYDPWVVVLVASLGNTLGGMISFFMGWLCKWEWLEKYFKINREKLMKVHNRVYKYGVWAAFFSWLPLVGDLIAIALGLMRISPWKTLLVMFLGKTLRFIITVGGASMTGWF